jgi:chromosome partitioning protein
MKAKVITVAQQKGGTGKSTLAAHIATYFALSGRSAALIDIDPQASLAQWYEIRKENGVATAPSLAFYAVSGWRVQPEIQALKHRADVIVIDSSPHAQNETRTAIREADLTLIPAQPSPTDLWATKTTVKLVEQERTPYRLLLNRVIRNANLAKEISSLFPEETTLPCSLANRIAFAAAMAEGRTVFEKPASEASREVGEVCAALEKILFPDAERKTA